MPSQILSIICFFTFTSVTLFCQEVVTAEFLQERTAADIEAQYGVPAEYDVEYYKITYKTPDPFSVQDTASGLIIVPKDRGFKYPLLSYSHGTVKDRNTGMSNLQAGDVNLAAIYGSFGFVVVAPDFLGMNESRGFHPYVHAATEASASIDMLLGVKEFALQGLDLHLNNLLFITGYSQGGHAAMATHRELEQNYEGEFDIVASIPMSGPYSISEKMIDFSLGDDPYYFTAYLPNTALSYKYVYPDLLKDIEMEDIFKAEYLDDIYRFRDGEIDLFQLNDLLINRLETDHGASKPKYMIHDSTLNNIKNNPNHPLSIALADNDVYDWAPKAFTEMYYCKGDDQVFYENSILALETMLANGAQNVGAANLSDVFDHVECVTPAITSAISFFFFTRGIVAGNEELDINRLKLAPNPFIDQILVEGLSIRDENPTLLNVYNMNGQKILEQRTNQSSYMIQMDQLKRGFYFLEVISEGKRSIHKLIKN